MEASLTFDPNTGMGNGDSPYSAALPTFLRQVLSLQGEAAANAESLSEGQGVVVNALKQRFNEELGRQRRPGNGKPDRAADRLRRQRARAVHGQGNARYPDEDVRSR